VAGDVVADNVGLVRDNVSMWVVTEDGMAAGENEAPPGGAFLGSDALSWMIVWLDMGLADPGEDELLTSVVW